MSDLLNKLDRGVIRSEAIAALGIAQRHLDRLCRATPGDVSEEPQRTYIQWMATIQHMKNDLKAEQHEEDANGDDDNGTDVASEGSHSDGR